MFFESIYHKWLISPPDRQGRKIVAYPMRIDIDTQEKEYQGSYGLINYSGYFFVLEKGCPIKFQKFNDCIPYVTGMGWSLLDFYILKNTKLLQRIESKFAKILLLNIGT